MTVTVERVGDRIHLRSPYATPGLGKKIPGGNFAKTGGPHWTFPLSIESCLLLREHFGRTLRIDRSLSDWYREELGRRETLGALAGASDANLERLPEVAPALAKAMASRTYQRPAARLIADSDAVLIADDPGLGKTLEAIGGIAESGVPGPYLVVVSPKIAARQVWGREIPRWLPGQNVLTLPEGRATRNALLDGFAAVGRFNREDETAGRESLMDLHSTWVVVHPEILNTKSFWDCRTCGEPTPYTRKPKPILNCGHGKDGAKTRHEHNFPQLFVVEWGAVIVDESDESLIARSGDPTQRRQGLMLLDVRKGGKRIPMSGTPWRSKPHQLWGTLNWMDPQRFGAKWRWIQQFWELGGYTGYEIGELRPDREVMLWESLKGIVLRRTKPEVAKDLPPKTYVGTPWNPSDFNSPIGVWLDMDPKQAKQYRQMLKTSAADIEGGKLDAVGTLAEMTRLHQLASSCGSMVRGDFQPVLPSNKWDYIAELLRQLGIPKDPGGKLIVVSQWTKFLFAFSQASGLELHQQCLLTGDMSETKRMRTIDAFNREAGTDSPHVMFLSMKAGGKALTLDSADDMVLIDEADADTMTQVEDRIHRVSNPRPVRYHYLRSVGTVDVGRSLVNAERDAEGRRLLDERRGVEYARKVLEASIG